MFNLTRASFAVASAFAHLPSLVGGVRIVRRSHRFLRGAVVKIGGRRYRVDVDQPGQLHRIRSRRHRP